MFCKVEIAPNLYWIGGEDKRQLKFEGVHATPGGMTYNSYLLLDEKAVLIDAVDRAIEKRFLETLEQMLDGRGLDCIVVNHLEPDHSATLGEVVRRYPQATILCTATCRELLGQFFDSDVQGRAVVVRDGDSLECGTRTLSFATAPMVHWPEVMATYDIQDKILFSADAFGSFGVLDGQLLDESCAFDEMLPEMRRYYANIVGKYGTQVAELLAKVEALDVQMIAPLHGHVLKRFIPEIVAAYKKWCLYQPEANAVAIAYASAYGNTRDVAEMLAFRLSDLGLHDIALFDLSVDDPSYVLSEVFRVSNVVLASITYNAGMHPAMDALITMLVSHNVRDRKFSIIENGSWGPAAGGLIRRRVEGIPGSELVGEILTVRSCLQEDQYEQVEKLAQQIVDSLEVPVSALAVDVSEVPVAELPTIVGAVKAPGPVPVHPGVHLGAPLTPPPGAKAASAEPAASSQPAQGESLRERSARKIGKPNGPRVIQVWRCSFCGMQVELEKGMMTDDFRCPQCFKSYPGLFFLVREKIVS